MKKFIHIVIFLFCSLFSFSQVGMFGEIRLFAGTFAPPDWYFCNGYILNIADYSALFASIGNVYGGDGVTNFALPDLRGRLAVGNGQGPSLSNYVLGQTGGNSTITYGADNLPAHIHTVTIQSCSDAGDRDNPAGNVPAIAGTNLYNSTANAEMGDSSMLVSLSNSGAGEAQNNIQPYLGINYIICYNGIYAQTENAYVGEIKLIATSIIPPNWVECSGQLINIFDNIQLFSLLGTTYGGDGRSTFAVPDLRGRVPISYKSGTYEIGNQGGTENESITSDKMANHNHAGSATLMVYSGVGNSDTPVDTYPAINPQRDFEFSSTQTATSELNSVTTDTTGTISVEPFENRQPYNTIKYIICTNGDFPSFPSIH
jgi:microcystin-dependent protein